MSGVLNLLLAGAASAIKDAYFNLTTLLLNTSSTNGAQNNTFLDSSTNNFTITRNGNATQGTFTPFSQTGWSNFFNGDVNCDLQTPSNAAFGYGTGDFCLEAYVYQQTNANARIIDHTAGAFNFGLLSTGIVTLFDGSTTHNTPSSSISLNTWTHICATRQGSTLRLFVNGVLKYNATFTVSKADSAVNIGSNPGGGGETLNGYISNLRIVKGGVPSAYSTSSTTNGTTVFTPSTTALTTSESLTAGSLSLLTCQSNRFVDNSANAFAISVTAGSPSVQAFSPFAPTAAYDSAVVGGSGYFDGTGDYITAPQSTNLDLGSGNWTLETWIYPTSNSGNRRVINKQNGANAWIFRLNASGSGSVAYFEIDGSGIVTGTTVIPNNSWAHIAIVRNSNTVTIYVNGVSDASATYSGTPSAPNAVTGIGAYAGGPSEYFFGYISNARFVKGSAVYTAAFTPPTAPLTAITNTSLLTNFTNAGIFDSAAKNNFETVADAQVSTTQAKWGTTSMYFDGTGDYLFAPPSEQFNITSSAYTVEMWINFASTSGTNIIFGFNGKGTTGSWQLLLDSGTLYWQQRGSAVNQTSYSWSPSTSTWYHVAVTWNGTTLRIFVNGTSVATNTSSPAFSTTQNGINVGGASDGFSINGYIDDFRITKGYARYTANFTAPTAAFPLQ